MRAGDRWTRTVAVAAAIVGLAACSPSDNPRSPASTPPSSSAAPTPTPLTDIPLDLYLRDEDLGVGELVTEAVAPDWDMRPCYRTFIDADMLLAARKPIGFRYNFSGRQYGDYGFEVISSYRPGGAEAYMAELRDGLTGPCARYEEVDWFRVKEITADGFAGDDSLRFTITDTDKATGRGRVTYAAAIRFGDVIVFLHVFEGYRDGLVEPENVDRILAAVIRRAAPLADRG